ncbi:ATP synthase subunit a [Roseimaritima multifibrata]|uniref:ATP synthase subunit a n=1 Tax=Roseimaritima multifibrata TaxID=1930274 RepID=A0A517M966_9BACT|nr:F0F1 ATP synthase subunit A [Roseimaritima multifibrata]QDS91337.1 ATP synthase subunit a [Roseimaritima multifibrata]
MISALLSPLVPTFASAEGGGHDPVDHVLPHPLHHEPLFTYDVPGMDGDMPFLHIYDGIYSFYITNHMLMTLFSGVLVVVAFWLVSRRIRPVGDGIKAVQTEGRFAQLMETMCAFVRDEVARPNLQHLTDKYIPYVWTIFFFILFCNVLGLIPFGPVLYLLTGNQEFTHWGGTATSNLALNGILALLSFVAIIVIGIRESGAAAFFGHFNPIGWDPKMLPMALGLYVLEWMGLVIKCVVLAMRLFGTMMAGHLVIAAFIALIFAAAEASASLGYGVGIAVLMGGTVLTLLELFICCLQAFIFTFLTVLFISAGAVHHHHGDGHDDEELDPLSDAGQMDMDKLLDPARLGPAT